MYFSGKDGCRFSDQYSLVIISLFLLTVCFVDTSLNFHFFLKCPLNEDGLQELELRVSWFNFRPYLSLPIWN